MTSTSRIFLVRVVTALVLGAYFLGSPLAAQESSHASVWDVLGVDQIGRATVKVHRLVKSTRAGYYANHLLVRPFAQATGLGIGTAPNAFGPPDLSTSPGESPAGSSSPGASSSGDSSSGAAATPANGGAAGGAPTAGANAASGGGGPASLPPSPAKVAGKVAKQTSPANVEVKVKSIRFLAKQDCVCYPEIVEALLQALDDCAEVVRFEALVALRHACRQGQCAGCSQNSPVGAPTLGCPCCACQEKVVARLTRLLRERDVTGRLRERSRRVRQLAASTIQECLRTSASTGIGGVPGANPSGARPDPPLPGQP